jgi:acyl carrier protein
MSQLKGQVKKLIAERMNLKIGPEQIGDEQALFDHQDGSLGLDSIDALDLVVGIYEEFSVELQESDMHIFANVSTVAAFIEQKQAAMQVA